MYGNWPTVLTGKWNYADHVPVRVRILRADVRCGSGDEEDPQDIRDDLPGEWYYVIYTTVDGRDVGGGVWKTLEEAKSAVAQVVGSTLEWDRSILTDQRDRGVASEISWE